MATVHVTAGKYVGVQISRILTDAERAVLEDWLSHLKYWSGSDPLIVWYPDREAGSSFDIGIHEDERGYSAASTDEVVGDLEFALRMAAYEERWDLDVRYI